MKPKDIDQIVGLGEEMIRKFLIGLAVGLLVGNVAVIGNAAPLTQTTDNQAQVQRAPKRTKRNKVKRATDDAVRDTAHDGKEVGRATGESVGNASEEAAKGTKGAAEDTSRATAKGVAKTGKEAAKVSKKIGRTFKGKKAKS